MATKKPVNRRKQDLRDKKTHQKTLAIEILKVTKKILIAIAVLWVLYYTVTHFSLPQWLLPKAPVAKEAAVEENYNLEYNFYSLLPQEKIVTPQAFIPSEDQNLIIQVASFKTKYSAKKLVKKLQQFGFTRVHYDNVKNNKGSWFRVLIGPLANISRAQEQQKKLRLNGLRKSVIKSLLKK